MRVCGEAEEHDVAGHVGDEHVTEPQVADGVDEPGDGGEGQQGGHGEPPAQRRRDSHRHSLLSQGGQLTAPSAALTPAMIAPPIAIDTNERRKPMWKKRHRIQARLTSSKAIVATAATIAAP